MLIAENIADLGFYLKKSSTSLNFKGSFWCNVGGSSYGIQNYYYQNFTRHFSYCHQPESCLTGLALWKFRYPHTDMDWWSCCQNATPKCNNSLVCYFWWTCWRNLGVKLKYSAWWLNDALFVEWRAYKAQLQNAYFILG